MKINILTELSELDASLEGQEDIDQNGGPNDAMRIRCLLAMAIPRLTALVDAADELAASVEFEINDSRSYKLMDLRSAIKIVRAGCEIDGRFACAKFPPRRVITNGYLPEGLS